MKQRKSQDLALYRGDDFIFLGNKRELAQFVGVDLATIWRWKQPKHVEVAQDSDMYYVIEVEDDA